MSEEGIKENVRESIQQSEEIDEAYEEEFIDLLEAKYSRLAFDEEEVGLSRMQIKGFKAITELDLPFSDRSTIIHGRNSKGKSSFIEAIRFNLLGRSENSPVTNPIHRDYEKTETDGFWEKNGTTYKVHREMENGTGYSGHQYPNVVKDPEESQHPPSERQTQSEVNDLIGYTPLHEQGFNRFNVFSLFSVITGELRSFYNSDDASELIELLFGITLTNVERAIENEISDCELEEEEKEAKKNRLGRIERANRLSEEIRNLRDTQAQIEATLAERNEERNDLAQLLENKEDIDEELSQKIDIKDDISDLQSRRDEKQEEFGRLKQEISKLESETVTDEIAPALQEIQQLVSLPDRCPVCTTDVSMTRQQHFHEHGDCPLCGEEMPTDRYETVSEVDEQGELLEREKRQEELAELESQKRTVKGEIQFLKDQIEEKKKQLNELEKLESESNFSQYKQRKQALEEEINDLKAESRSLELEIDTKRVKLHEAAREVWRWTQLEAERQRKEQREQALEKFKTIIVRERADARKELKSRLEERMEMLLERFTQGTFANATGVRFAEGDSYSYTVYTTERSELKPKLLEESNAELTLHMLLFHTAILSELEEEAETVPLKVFFIDSPYGNGHDDENARDITEFLLELPAFLDEYQLVVAMADSNLGEQGRLEQAYDISPVEDYITVSDSE